MTGLRQSGGGISSRKEFGGPYKRQRHEVKKDGWRDGLDRMKFSVANFLAGVLVKSGKGSCRQSDKRQICARRSVQRVQFYEESATRRDETLREARKELAPAISNLESLRSEAENDNEDIFVPGAGIALQYLLCEDGHKQLDARLANLKKLWPQLKPSERELNTLYNQ